MKSLTELLTPTSYTRGEPTFEGASEGAPVFDGLFRALDSVGGLVKAFKSEPAHVQQNAASTRQPLEQSGAQIGAILPWILGGLAVLVAIFFIARK